MEKCLKEFRFAVIVFRHRRQFEKTITEIFIRDLWDGAEIQFENPVCAEKALIQQGFKSPSPGGNKGEDNGNVYKMW